MDEKEVMDLLQRYADALDKLTEENQFLTDTIKQQKLCLITQERRELLDKVRNSENESDKIRAEAEDIKNTYGASNDRLLSLMEEFDVKNKELDDIIEKRADEKIEEIKEKLIKKSKREFKKKEEELKAQYEETNSNTLDEIAKYKKFFYISTGAAAVLLIVAIVAFLI